MARHFELNQGPPRNSGHLFAYTRACLPQFGRSAKGPSMKFRFPIVIIDEDYRSENTSGLGIRALADAIVKEGFEVLGATSYGDLSQFAQQQSRAGAFILSIDDEEFSATPGEDGDPP